LPDLVRNLDEPELIELCREEAAKYAVTCPDRPPFASPAHWAAFTANGLAYL
jgi:hypothetical protein